MIKVAIFRRTDKGAKIFICDLPMSLDPIVAEKSSASFLFYFKNSLDTARLIMEIKHSLI